MGGLKLISIHRSLFLAVYRKSFHNDIILVIVCFSSLYSATMNAVVTFISVICQAILELSFFFFITSAHQLSQHIEQHSEDNTQPKVVIRHIQEIVTLSSLPS